MWQERPDKGCFHNDHSIKEQNVSCTSYQPSYTGGTKKKESPQDQLLLTDILLRNSSVIILSKKQSKMLRGESKTKK
jgi:hypothetical protein